MRAIELAGVVLLVWVGACAPPHETSDGRYAMGSILEITLVGAPEAAMQPLFDGLYLEVARLEALASRHDEKSALARLNRGEPLGPLEPPLRELLSESERLAALSGGAFDISVGVWVELWVAAAKRNRLPDAAERAKVHSRTGPDAFHLDEQGRATLAPGARLDLGAIAKGYALDRLVAQLPSALRGALLNFGQSSYWAVGRPAEGDHWRLLLRDPDGGYAGVIRLRDQALSISASLGQSSEIEGRHYGHIIDPRSGEPLQRNAQVAVLAPNAAMAEALSTAALVMGAVEGIAWIEALEGCEALWLEPGVSPQPTTGWGRAARFKPR